MTDLNTLCITCLSTVEDGASISAPMLDFLCKELHFKCQLEERHSKLVCRKCYMILIEIRRFCSQLRDVELYLESRSKALEADEENHLIEEVDVDEEVEEIELGNEFEAIDEIEETGDVITVEEFDTSIVDIPEDLNDPILIDPEPILNVEYLVVESSEPPSDQSKRNVKTQEIKYREKIPACLLCSKVFNTTTELRSHENAHRNRTEPAPLPVFRRQGRQRNCPQCGETFHSMRDLTGHLKNHELDKIKPFRCFKCNRRFLTKEALQDHKLVHRGTEVQVCRCDICHKKYLNQSTLEAHKRLAHNW